jgi:virginiamycin B lyase
MENKQNKMFMSRRKAITGLLTTGAILSVNFVIAPSSLAATLSAFDQHLTPKKLKAKIRTSKVALSHKKVVGKSARASLKSYTLQTNTQVAPLAAKDLQATFTAYPVNTTSNPALEDITVGDNGEGFWFTETGANRIGMITPQGVITEYKLPLSGYVPGAIANGPGDTFWFTYQKSDNDPRYIGRLTVSSKQVTLYALPSSTEDIQGLVDICRGPNDTLWYISDEGTVGSLTASGALTLFVGAVPRSYSIASGADGALWITHRDGVVRMTTSGDLTGYGPDTYDFGEITAGRNNDLWFTGQSPDEIYNLTTSGQMTAYDLPTDAGSPWAITHLGNGTFAFGASPANGSSSQVGTITPAGDIQLFSTPDNDDPLHMVYAGWANEVWLTTKSKIYKFRVTGN